MGESSRTEVNLWAEMCVAEKSFRAEKRVLNV